VLSWLWSWCWFTIGRQLSLAVAACSTSSVDFVVGEGKGRAGLSRGNSTRVRARVKGLAEERRVRVRFRVIGSAKEQGGRAFLEAVKRGLAHHKHRSRRMGKARHDLFPGVQPLIRVVDHG